eukprot:scaffold12617_cov172-Amphora_coffeaeformis.AAC.3
MSPRKRLSPSSAHCRPITITESTDVESASVSPLSTLALPSLIQTRSRKADEIRLVTILCWLTVALTMGAIGIVATVEQRAQFRRLRNIPVLEKTEASQGRRAMDLMFQTHSTDAPVCTSVSENNVSFTLATQCSDTRLWMMKYHCERWSGPISLVVYTNRTLQQVEGELNDMNCQNEDLRVQIHPADNLVDYPINTLRNMAFSNVRTSHAFFVDVDFWPANDLEDTFRLHRSYLAEDSRRALVIPAFSLRRQCPDYTDCPEKNIPEMPTTQQDIYDGLIAKRMSPFDPTNRGGHGSTRYTDWLQQPAQEILPIECFRSNRYEPYVVVRYCKDLPPFQEGFTGYGKNKVSWMMQLRRAGWTFGQIGYGFVVHYPHLDSPARKAWNGAADSRGRSVMMQKPTDESLLLQTKRGQTDKLYVEFRDWLEETYPSDESEKGREGSMAGGVRTPLCEDATDDNAKLWVAEEHLL